ncbi:unnamed protein product [Gongylonema pulchrum]|uniref:Pkinase_fungal domain-containing protein n=1 Tax=Gongylonema pulchrum TaxID=637853 RepID=A0A183DYF1_9BILA|nr:unnamed protein product [Gongylonema pulchrum]
MSRGGLRSGEGVEIAMEMTPGEPLRLSAGLITHHIIMSEYALVCRDPIDGLYTVPSARDIFDFVPGGSVSERQDVEYEARTHLNHSVINSLSEWFGLLFIRRGVYAGAVLRFTSVVFDLDVFHPHVNATTRELDLKRYFVDGWKPERYHIYHVLLIVQRSSAARQKRTKKDNGDFSEVFYALRCRLHLGEDEYRRIQGGLRTFFTFDTDPSSCVNADAAALLRDNKEAYRMRASELIK